MKRPTYIKQEAKVDPAVAENQRLEILGDVEDDFNDEFSSSDKFMPIKLSESNFGYHFACVTLLN